MILNLVKSGFRWIILFTFNCKIMAINTNQNFEAELFKAADKLRK